MCGTDSEILVVGQIHLHASHPLQLGLNNLLCCVLCYRACTVCFTELFYEHQHQYSDSKEMVGRAALRTWRWRNGIN